MTISELGALGEFIATIGVLITLNVLAYGVRQDTKTARRTNIRQATEANSRTLNPLLDGDVAEIFIKGLKSLDDLSDVDRYRFDNPLSGGVHVTNRQKYADERVRCHVEVGQ